MADLKSENCENSENKQYGAVLNAPQSTTTATTATTTTTAAAPSAHDRRTSSANFGNTNRTLIAVIVYFALLLDNVLLTVIVPILPDYLATLHNKTHYVTVSSVSLAGGVSVGSTYAANNLAYRYLNGTGQTQLTKHPIPGKSMINFTIFHTNNTDETMAGKLPVNALDQHAFIKNNSVKATMQQEDNQRHSESLTSENGSIGILLAMKALVQLIFNPIVGNMSSKYGYRLPIIIGTFCLLISALVFAIGETYWALLLARAIQGIGSACIGVCGMSLVAQHYPEEERRSKVMGIILGSIALGVLIGYPFGSILYDLIGKSAPFIILSTIIFLNLGTQLLFMDLTIQPEVITNSVQQAQSQLTKWEPLLKSKMILAIVVAIWFSTSTMAILEPCLPIWLMEYLQPTKWQLGTVFIPDSLGYFVGTNFFGGVAYKFGQIKISCISLILVGISSILIPSSTTVAQLLLPHFVLGLGIGIIDAALVPLLATFVDATLTTQDEQYDANTMSSYGTVYAIQQTSVSLAYCLAPLLGGELAQAFGFPSLMRFVGLVNIIYGPILVALYQKYDPKTLREQHNELLLTTAGRTGSQYNKLYNSVDME